MEGNWTQQAHSCESKDTSQLPLDFPSPLSPLSPLPHAFSWRDSVCHGRRSKSQKQRKWILIDSGADAFCLASSANALASALVNLGGPFGAGIKRKLTWQTHHSSEGTHFKTAAFHEELKAYGQYGFVEGAPGVQENYRHLLLAF